MEVTMETRNTKRYDSARKRVDQLKGFYIHFMVYFFINTFILINIYLNLRAGESFWQWGHFFVLFGWGIGLGFHAAKTFGFNPIFGKDWEERQIRKYIEKDRDDANRFI